MSVKYKGQTFTDAQLQVLLDSGAFGAVAQKHDPASTSLAYTGGLHGPLQGGTGYGAFSSPGVRPQMFSTFVRPRSFASLLGVKRSEFTEEILETMTGITAGSGTNASGWCVTPPQVGQLKTCQQMYKFGSYLVKTKINAIPEIGQLRNRAEVSREIINAGPAANPLIPDIMYRLVDTRSQLQYELYTVGADLERTMERVLIQGDITQAYTSTELGWMKEFNGLDAQIKTGYTDLISSAACAAMDSSIITFGAAIGSTIGGGDGRNLVQAASDLYYGIMDIASRIGMADGLQLVWLMRNEMFRALTEVWACQYATYRCSSSNAGQPILNDAVVQNQMRIAMMQGQYLLIDGVEVPVVFTDGIDITTADNITFTADMYLVPIAWRGMKLLNLEYFPMDNAYAREFAAFGDADAIQYLNNGMFIVGVASTPLCKEYHFGAKFRLILETPFLAGRIDDISFAYRAPSRDAYPGASRYKNGGTTFRAA